jgi:hypothetical protein
MNAENLKDIEEKLSKTYVVTHTEDFFFNNSFKDTKIYATINYYPLNLLKKMKVDIKFKINHIIRDMDYFLISDNDNTTLTKISSINKDSMGIFEQYSKLTHTNDKDNLDKEPYVNMEIKIGTDELNDYHEFRTEKLDSLMARTGGLFQSLVFILNFISYFIIDYQYYAKVLTNSLDIDFISCEDAGKLNVKNSFNPEILKKNFHLFRQSRYSNFEQNQNQNKLNPNNNNNRIEKEEAEPVDLNKSSKRHILKFIDKSNSSGINILEEKDKDKEKEKENDNKNKSDLEMNHINPFNINVNSINNFENRKKLEENSETFKRNLEFEKANYLNKMNSYVVNVQKKYEKKEKKQIKIKDDVFLKSNSFHICDLIYSYIKKIIKYNNENGFKIDNKFKLFEKSKEIFQLNFDVDNMIKKNIEIDLIKYLLLNNDQIKMYSLVKKPLISLNNIDLNDFDLIYDESSRQKLYTAKELKEMDDDNKFIFQKSYENILEKQSTSINKKLLKLVNERLSIMFENFDNYKNNEN